MTGRSLQTEAARKDIGNILQNHKELNLLIDSFADVTKNSHVTSSEAATCVCNGRRSIDSKANEEHLPELVTKIKATEEHLDVVSNKLRCRVNDVNERETSFSYDKPSLVTHSQNEQEWKIKFDRSTGLRSVLTEQNEDNRLLKDSDDNRVLKDSEYNRVFQHSGVTFGGPEKQQTATNLDGKQKAENSAEKNDTTSRKDRVTAIPKSILVPPAFRQSKTEKPSVSLHEPEFVESQYWEIAIRDEIEIGKTWKRSAGIDTILCIDISRSMRDTWDAVLDFITNFVDAVRSCQPLAVDIQEHIGIVTLGHETRILQHMTKDYSEVLRKIHLLSPDGTSPMFWAIEMVYALAKSSGRLLDLKTDGFISYPRVILLTDGWPTDRNLSGGFDRSEPRIERMEQRSIIHMIQDLQKEMPLSFYTVACGPNSNTAFLTTVAIKTGGRLSTLDEWPRFAKYGCNMMLAAEVYTLWKSPVTGDATLGSKEKVEKWLSTMWGITEQDKEDIIALLGKGMSSSEDDDDDDDDDDNGSTTSNEESGGMMGFTFPRVGTRVRRGADWRWDLQDQNGPGTIVGYSTDNPGWVWIEWDIQLIGSPKKNLYRYGAEGAFDVQVVEDTRVISPGRPLAIGCQVKKGPQWKQGTDDPEANVTGTVYYVNERLDKAKVSWSDGRKGNYSFGIPGKNEIEYCGPLKPNEPGPFSFSDLYINYQSQALQIPGCTCSECQVKRHMLQHQNGNELDQDEDTKLQDPRTGQPDEVMNRYDLGRYRHQQDLQDSKGQQLDANRQDFVFSPTDFLREGDIAERSYFSDSSDLSNSSDEIPSISLVNPSDNEMPKQGYELSQIPSKSLVSPSNNEMPKHGYELPESQIDQYIIDDYKSKESPKVQERNLLNKRWHAEVPASKKQKSRLPKELLASFSDKQYGRTKLDDKFSQSMSFEVGKTTKPNKKGNKNAKPKIL